MSVSHDKVTDQDEACIAVFIPHKMLCFRSLWGAFSVFAEKGATVI